MNRQMTLIINSKPTDNQFEIQRRTIGPGTADTQSRPQSQSTGGGFEAESTFMIGASLQSEVESGQQCILPARQKVVTITLS